MAYSGSAYDGWGIQPDNDTLHTVQQTLFNLLDPLLESATTGNRKDQHKHTDTDKDKDALNESSSC